MKPIILLYNVSSNKVNILRPVVSMMGIGIKLIKEEHLNCKAGALAYPDMFESVCASEDTMPLNDFSEEFMLLCGMDKTMLDKILNFMNKKKISVSLKAMLTETNKDWSVTKLISEIKAERDEIAKSIKK